MGINVNGKIKKIINGATSRQEKFIFLQIETDSDGILIFSIGHADNPVTQGILANAIAAAVADCPVELFYYGGKSVKEVSRNGDNHPNKDDYTRLTSFSVTYDF